MPLADSEEFAGLEDPDKVIVRSDGTVTYVGKDIAYQLWKFGLLGQDFGYRCWQEEAVWETCHARAAPEHPPFGGAYRVINVIDARQSYLQKIVRAGLAGARPRRRGGALGALRLRDGRAVAGDRAPARVTSTRARARTRRSRCRGARGSASRPTTCIDRLEAKSREEIGERNRELAGGDARRAWRTRSPSRRCASSWSRRPPTASSPSTSTRRSASRASRAPTCSTRWCARRNIRRRLRRGGPRRRGHRRGRRGSCPPATSSEDLWDLILDGRADRRRWWSEAVAALELSLVARHALEIAQRFNAVYHRHPILQESDAAVRAARLATVQIFRRGLEDTRRVAGHPDA